MKTIVYKSNPLVNRDGWGAGPWDDEPDKVQFLDEETGLPCLIKRNHFGALCGYVGIPSTHPLFEVDYNGAYQRGFEPSMELTFSDLCSPHGEGEEGQVICHVVEAGEDDHIWWFGFDCAHAHDISPGMRMVEYPGATYKTIQYVEHEVKVLAHQLKEFSL